MIQLSDPRWQSFEGGYRILYDASVALRKLEQATGDKEIDSIFYELWNELHHQGDVGVASYISVPHIIRIAKEKKLLSYNVFGLISAIEIERHRDNPILPSEYEDWYLQSLREGIPQLVSMAFADKWDVTLTSTILSALAVSKGHMEMAQALLKMEDIDVVNEFLENF
jgi:hypothetical protein